MYKVIFLEENSDSHKIPTIFRMLKWNIFLGARIR